MGKAAMEPEVADQRLVDKPRTLTSLVWVVILVLCVVAHIRYAATHPPERSTIHDVLNAAAASLYPGPQTPPFKVPGWHEFTFADDEFQGFRYEYSDFNYFGSLVLQIHIHPTNADSDRHWHDYETQDQHPIDQPFSTTTYQGLPAKSRYRTSSDDYAEGELVVKVERFILSVSDYRTNIATRLRNVMDALYGASHRRGLFTPVALPEISGVVSWPNGTPVSTTVKCHGNGAPQYTTADIDGRFSCQVVPGQFFGPDESHVRIDAGPHFTYTSDGRLQISIARRYALVQSDTDVTDVELTLLAKEYREDTSVITLKGTVLYRPSGYPDWVPVPPGLVLQEGDRILAGEDSSALIFIRGRGLVRINPFSQLGLDKKPEKGLSTMLLELFIGSIAFKGTDGVCEEFELKTSAAVVGCLGTAFSVEAGDTVTTIQVAEGTVWVRAYGAVRTTHHDHGHEVSVDSNGNTTNRALTVPEQDNLDRQLEDIDFLLSPVTAEIIEHDFSTDATGWQTDGSGRWSVFAGHYEMIGNGANDAGYSRLEMLSVSDYTIEANVRKVSGDNDTYAYGYGLYLRSDVSAENFYEFNILEDGRYMIGKTVDGRFSRLVEYTATSALNTGLGSWNRLRVVIEGSTLSFFANDVWLTTITDSDLLEGAPGLFGIDAASSFVRDVVEFDDVFVVYQPATSTTEPDAVDLTSILPVIIELLVDDPSDSPSASGMH
jgi:hypothetical protein